MEEVIKILSFFGLAEQAVVTGTYPTQTICVLCLPWWHTWSRSRVSSWHSGRFYYSRRRTGVTVTVNTNILLMLTRVLTERSFILAAAASHLLPTRAESPCLSSPAARLDLHKVNGIFFHFFVRGSGTCGKKLNNTKASNWLPAVNRSNWSFSRELAWRN